jgi:hypothetical protein
MAELNLRLGQSDESRSRPGARQESAARESRRAVRSRRRRRSPVQAGFARDPDPTRAASRGAYLSGSPRPATASPKIQYRRRKSFGGGRKCFGCRYRRAGEGGSRSAYRSAPDREPKARARRSSAPGSAGPRWRSVRLDPPGRRAAGTGRWRRGAGRGRAFEETAVATDLRWVCSARDRCLVEAATALDERGSFRARSASASRHARDRSAAACGARDRDRCRKTCPNGRPSQD